MLMERLVNRVDKIYSSNMLAPWVANCTSNTSHIDYLSAHSVSQILAVGDTYLNLYRPDCMPVIIV